MLCGSAGQCVHSPDLLLRDCMVGSSLERVRKQALCLPKRSDQKMGACYSTCRPGAAAAAAAHITRPPAPARPPPAPLQPAISQAAPSPGAPVVVKSARLRMASGAPTPGTYGAAGCGRPQRSTRMPHAGASTPALSALTWATHVRLQARHCCSGPIGCACCWSNSLGSPLEHDPRFHLPQACSRTGCACPNVCMFAATCSGLDPAFNCCAPCHASRSRP